MFITRTQLCIHLLNMYNSCAQFQLSQLSHLLMQAIKRQIQRLAVSCWGKMQNGRLWNTLTLQEKEDWARNTLGKSKEETEKVRQFVIRNMCYIVLF
jgi:hypothetical protein